MAQKQLFTVLIIASLLLSINCKLFTDSVLEQYLNKYGRQQFQTIGTQKTQCNTPDITPILPKGKTVDDFIVRSGYLEIDQGSFGFIFWGAQAAQGDVSQLETFPNMIWLQGGPGGSSQFGNFGEMGPIRVDGTSEFTYTYNPYSWNQNYNMIFIDNPLGTGTSIANTEKDIPTTTEELAEQFFAGLTVLYENKNGCFNELGITKNPLFISGESYAGKYVPNYAHHIMSQDSNNIVYKALKQGGIAVGDGFTDPEAIMKQLPPYAYQLSFFNQKELDTGKYLAKLGSNALDKGKTEDAKMYFNLVMTQFSLESGVQSAYDWTLTGNEPDSFDLTSWFNQDSIKNGVFQFPSNLDFNEISMPVYNALGKDFMKTNVVQIVEKLLAMDFPILYYNGQVDVIVCLPCTENWLDQVNYSASDSFKNLAFKTWSSVIADGSSKVAGYFKQAANLHFATINQAGHMVPADQPESAYTMITSFVEYCLLQNTKEHKYETSMFDYQKENKQRQEPKQQKQQQQQIIEEITI